jgi:hypothetical protein
MVKSKKRILLYSLGRKQHSIFSFGLTPWRWLQTSNLRNYERMKKEKNGFWLKTFSLWLSQQTWDIYIFTLINLILMEWEPR